MFCTESKTLFTPDFCAYVTKNSLPANHVITANEGNAVALASGYHMATGKTALVYLQVGPAIHANIAQPTSLHSFLVRNHLQALRLVSVYEHFYRVYYESKSVFLNNVFLLAQVDLL